MNFFANYFGCFSKKNKTTPNSSFDEPRINSQNNDNILYIKCLLHEIRHPLNNMTLGLETLKTLIEKDEKMKEDKIIQKTMKNIRESCDFMGCSLDDFIQIRENRQEEFIGLKLIPFSIYGLIKNVEQLLFFKMEKMNINIRYIFFNKSDEWVIGDPSQLKHMFINLLSNSLKYRDVEDTQSIIIEINAIYITPLKKKYMISIIDNNPNISPKIKKRLFEKFNTTKGTGLGLYISKRIVELHGGQITHKNLFPKGNKFIIDINFEVCVNDKKSMNNYFELSSNASSSIKINAKNSKENTVDLVKNRYLSILETTNQVKNILIVDDSQLTRKMTKNLIRVKYNDIRIDEAEDGIEAIVKVINDLEFYDLIFVDNIMPKMCGPFVCKILRALGYNKLLIGLSGTNTKKDIDDFYNNGANLFITKPLTFDILSYIFENVRTNGLYNTTFA